MCVLDGGRDGGATKAGPCTGWSSCSILNADEIRLVRGIASLPAHQGKRRRTGYILTSVIIRLLCPEKKKYSHSLISSCSQ